MSFFLKKTTPSSKGVYLQIYESVYIPGVGKRNHSYKSLGYLSDLIASGIDNPISHFQKEVDKLNESSLKRKTLEIGDVSLSKNVGYFLLKIMFDYLNMDNDINIVASTLKPHYKFSELLRAMCYAQIVNPSSKLKACESIIPNIYGMENYTYDQILDFVSFLGSDYHKYIEVLNKHISNKWERNFNKVYFDCTNYYFEIDLENEFLRKGPSKENRKSPLLGQALLLDADQIPLDTTFYPGNKSEKEYLRKRIEEMKVSNNVTGRVIHVADKGLNCARNIYSAVIEANDGYIFSKSIRGTGLSNNLKEWIFKNDNDLNIWHEVRDYDGTLLYKYKEFAYYKNKEKVTYGKFEYHCKINADDEKETYFTVNEKRIVTYNPVLARKQRKEILKEVEKLKDIVAYKTVMKKDIGDCAKYLNLEAVDKDGEKVKIATSLNNEKIEQDLEFCGYNLIVTSEINADPLEIYKTYHNLWRIEESFKIMKTYLEARPVYLSDEDAIYGHFLICYISLTILKLLELKLFKDEINVHNLIEFMRQYNFTKARDESYINTSTKSRTYLKIKEKLGLSKLGHVYLTKKEINDLLKTEIDDILTPQSRVES